MKNKKEIIILVSSFLVGGIAMLLLLRFTPLFNYIISSNKLIIRKDTTKIYEKNSLAKSVEKIYDAVVVVQGYNIDDIESTGTGFIYKVDDKYGYILTNEHVVSEDKAKVIMTTEEEVEADILGKDKYLDLAVLRIEKKYVTLVANIGSSKKVNLGDTVFTVGTPLGYEYRGSITSGILSGKDRKVTTTIDNSKDSEWIMRVLQIDASINPGNSGGPLLNANGEVIGICTLKLIDDNIEGMGFAIPIEYAMAHLDSLEKGEKIKWPVLGVDLINVSNSSALMKHDIEIPKDITEGSVVAKVNEGSNILSKLKKGDIIIKINDTKIKNNTYVRYELYQHQAGDIIDITYIRNNKEKHTKIKLKEK